MRSALVLADTGPLFALADPSDQFHDRAQREAAALQRERKEVVVAYPILFEAHTLVLRRLGVRAGRRWLTEIRAGASVAC